MFLGLDKIKIKNKIIIIFLYIILANKIYLISFEKRVVLQKSLTNNV